MELEQVKGLGPKKIEALRGAGIATADDLAGIDLRRTVGVEGVSKDALKQYKQRARQALARAGEEVPKAPYRTRSNGRRKAPSAKEPVPTPGKREPEITTKPGKATQGKKRGFLRRILRN